LPKRGNKRETRKSTLRLAQKGEKQGDLKVRLETNQNLAYKSEISKYEAIKENIAKTITRKQIKVKRMLKAEMLKNA